MPNACSSCIHWQSKPEDRDTRYAAHCSKHSIWVTFNFGCADYSPENNTIQLVAGENLLNKIKSIGFNPNAKDTVKD